MGRPKKEATTETKDAEQVSTETAEPVVSFIDMPDTPPVDLKNLKSCPKCGDPCSGPYKDIHGLYRCNCSHPKCGFWDSMVWETPEAAARSWQLAGGPNPRNE